MFRARKLPKQWSLPNKLHIIGVASGLGSPDSRCRKGPQYLHKYGITTVLEHTGRDVVWHYMNSGKIDSRQSHLIVAGTCRRVARLVESLSANGERFLVLGGDHSIAIGTWTGARAALGRGELLGLIWIDAHMDCHRPETSPSGNVHGMPLACLLGYGDPRLSRLGKYSAVLQPENVCLVGVRSFESQEADLIDRIGVRVFFMEEINCRGLETVMQEARKIAGSGTGGIGVSIDLDAVDPLDAPGVSTPVPGGLRGRALIAALDQIGGDPSLLGIEVAEFNPDCDIDNRTADLVCALVNSVLY